MTIAENDGLRAQIATLLMFAGMKPVPDKLIPDILPAATGHQPAWRGVAINTLVLFAEYAATIKTIPPRKTREKRAVGKGAFIGQ